MLTISKPNSSRTSSSRRPIHITSQDKERLEDLLAEVSMSDLRRHGDLNGVRKELERAVIVDSKAVPNDVITMNSRADLLDLESGETLTLTLVFPADAAIEEGKISVLAPIGAGMLGYRVADEFEWNVPAGVRRMRVTRVAYQPEAAGNFER
jgi:regulator of nucleoside diphosphate kinase